MNCHHFCQCENKEHHIRCLDLFILPHELLQAIVIFYDSHQSVTSLLSLKENSCFENTLIFLLVRVKQLLKRKQEKIDKIYKLFYCKHNVTSYNFVAPLHNSVDMCQYYTTCLFPKLCSKSKYTRAEKLFMQKFNENKLPIGKLFDHLCQSIVERKTYLKKIFDQHATPISETSFPLWLTKCLTLLSDTSINDLYSYSCFNLFHYKFHIRLDYDVKRHILLLSTLDCSQSNDEKYRLTKILGAFKKTLLSDLSHFFSDYANDEGMRGIQNISIPVVETCMRHGNGENGSFPYLNSLENLLTSSTWDTIDNGALSDNLEKLTRLTNELCSSLNGSTKTDVKHEIRMMGDQSILKRAVSLAEPYEVIRCFHISPLIVNRCGTGMEDERSRGKETGKACTLLIMLSVVRNLSFEPLCDTGCQTVIITSGAKNFYTKKQTNLHITFRCNDSTVLNQTCLENVLVAIRNKRDVVI